MDVRTQALENFADMSTQFFTALQEQFPECPATAQVCAEIKLGNAMPKISRTTALEETVQAFNDTMSPFYARVRAQDPTVFEQDLPFLHRIDMVTKWQAMDSEARQTVFEYLNHLVTNAQMYGFYRGVPDAMLRKITDTAVNAAQSGTMDVAAMAKSIMEEVDPAEMQSFAAAMQSDPSQVTSMLQTVSHMVGGDAGGAAALPAMLQQLGQR